MINDGHVWHSQVGLHVLEVGHQLQDVDVLVWIARSHDLGLGVDNQPSDVASVVFRQRQAMIDNVARMMDARVQIECAAVQDAKRNGIDPVMLSPGRQGGA